MKKPGYAIVQIVLQREVRIMLDSERKPSYNEQYEMLLETLEKKYGSFGDNDDFDILECDYISK